MTSWDEIFNQNILSKRELEDVSLKETVSTQNTVQDLKDEGDEDKQWLFDVPSFCQCLLRFKIKLCENAISYIDN